MKVLLANLPRESALARAIDPELADWSTVQELLAVVAELLDQQNRMYHKVNFVQTGAAPKPLRVRRPRDGELAAMAQAETRITVVDAPRMATSEEMVRFFRPGDGLPAGGSVRYFPNPEQS